MVKSFKRRQLRTIGCSSDLSDKRLSHFVASDNRLKKLELGLSLFRTTGKVGPPTAPFSEGFWHEGDRSPGAQEPGGKRLDQAARPSFKARPSILGGQFQNPLPWDHGDPGKQHGFGLLNCSKLSVIRM